MMIHEHLGQVAYEAYCATRGWKSFNNEPLPQWNDVRQDIKDGWMTAARAVRITMRGYIEDIKLLDTIDNP